MNIRIVRSVPISIAVLLVCCFTPFAQAQQTFSSPQAAADALARAAEDGDPAAFSLLFGSAFIEQTGTGDPQADRLGIQRLATLVMQGYDVSMRGGRKALIELGADKYPFAVFIIQIADDSWTFDVTNGLAELLRRRIEANEKRVTQVAQTYAAAQQQYYAMTQRGSGTGVYAKQFLSSPGKADGLYWDRRLNGIQSPLEPLVMRAENLGYQKQSGDQALLMGYYFRVLNAQGEFAPGKSQSFIDANGQMTKGFALLAYPARYGVSGNTSFIVGDEGIVYARDLGPRSTELGEKIMRFDPDPSWNAIAGGSPEQTGMESITTNSVSPFGG
jgi:hypothetical protein